ncbi:hypothetical protein GGQ74_001176 [Desulfobaculum xiamenense]|uniref:Uncharacterized protein n=1 Tax=Desulfobaculum xiamenense TaxID=995050 RepID=A0A846QFH4_9BACT|nr:hypothetical protein [Desulfobaculum xiamenense]NJB67536.1 hypothetical protein [Desulfobaculum xiamenense]
MTVLYRPGLCELCENNVENRGKVCVLERKHIRVNAKTGEPYIYRTDTVFHPIIRRNAGIPGWHNIEGPYPAKCGNFRKRKDALDHVSTDKPNT